MSKMKRKWLRVIEYEETGRPIDELTRSALLETHPELPILQDEAAMPRLGVEEDDRDVEGVGFGGFDDGMHGDFSAPPPPAMMRVPEAVMQHPLPHGHAHAHIGLPEPPIEPQIDSQLEQQIQREIATADPPRA